MLCCLRSHCCSSVIPFILLCSAHSLVLIQYLCFPTDVFQLSPTPQCQVLPMLWAPMQASQAPAPFWDSHSSAFPLYSCSSYWLLCKQHGHHLSLTQREGSRGTNALSPLPVSEIWINLKSFTPQPASPSLACRSMQADETVPLHVPYFFWKSSWTWGVKFKFMDKG